MRIFFLNPHNCFFGEKFLFEDDYLMSLDLSKLNEEQIKPVLDTEGAVLVTAGAGSGKTRLLTHRIAHLIEDLKVKPYNILAITFTNKAANEMRQRLASMLVDKAEDIWVFTFHALCIRILRKFIKKSRRIFG